MNNATEIFALNASGVQEVFLYPRWSDNATYLNYGSSGFYIRNNGGYSTMFMSNSNYVGIGTTSPAYPLDVAGNCRVTSSTSNTNPSVIITKDPGNYSTFGNTWQHQAQLQIQNSNAASMVLGMSTDGVGIIQGAQSGVGYNNICLNPFSANVGIGTFTPQYKLDVNGAVNASSYNASSDYRIKKNVVTLDETFSVDNLRPVTYNNSQLKKQDIGLIAHELQEVYPELVSGEKDGEEMQSVNYIGLIPILINEIKMLKKELSDLKKDFYNK